MSTLRKSFLREDVAMGGTDPARAERVRLGDLAERKGRLDWLWDDPAARRVAVGFSILAVLALSLRLSCMTGLIGSDDLHYAKYARAVTEGTYTQTVDQTQRKHHALRYAIILPVAAVYKIFGVSEWTTILIPLLASVASVLLLAEIGRQLFGFRVAMLAGALFATSPMQLRLATMLLPEPIAGCFVLMGALCFVHARRRGGLLWVLSGMILGVAYLAKEPALFIGGALFLYAAWDSGWRGALLFALGLASVIAAEHAYYVLVRGDILFRPHSTQLYNIDAPPDPGDLPKPSLAYRLFRKYPEAMLVPDSSFGLHSLACILWAACALMWKPRRHYGLMVLWTLVPFLYLNFGTWNFSHYSPLPTDPRYIELIYPPLMLLSAVALSRALASRRTAVPTAVAMGVVMIVGVGCALVTRGDIADARQMTVLREIVRAAQRDPSQSIYTAEGEWRRALDVFDASLAADSPAAATVIVEPDQFGLPALKPAPFSSNDPSKSQ